MYNNPFFSKTAPAKNEIEKLNCSQSPVWPHLSDRLKPGEEENDFFKKF